MNTRLPLFFSHLTGNATISRGQFLQEGRALDYTYVVQHAASLLAPIAPLIRKISEMEEAGSQRFVPIAADIGYLRQFLAMHNDAFTAFAAGTQPDESFESYLNGLYELHPRFNKIYRFISQ